MGQFFFFTDTDLISQTAAQAYGAKPSTSNDDFYQVVSLHSASSAPTAYAVCSGKVAVQEIPGSSPAAVNVILQPSEQPEPNLPNIQFIIYKNIQKSSLVDGNLVALNSLDLCVRMKEDKDKLNASEDEKNGTPGATNDRPLAAGFGLDWDATVYPDTEPIDKLFFREDPDIQLPSVEGGHSIGTFINSEFGIEIICERVGYQPALSIARSLAHTLTVPVMPGTPTQPQQMDHWLAKEEVLNYLDPAAFFGQFYPKSLTAKTSTGDFTEYSGNALYDQVVSTFENCNRVYLDLRNDQNQSFNFFLNYGQNIELAFDGAGPTGTMDYYYSKWPVLELENGDFPTGNTDKKSVLQLAMPKGDNELPMLILSAGSYDKGKITDAYPNPPEGDKKFHNFGYPTGTITDPVKLAVPNCDHLGGTTVVATYLLGRYVKQFDRDKYPQRCEGTVIEKSNYLDNLFCPFDMHIPFDETPGVSQVRVKVYPEEAYVDDGRNMKWDCSVALGTAIDDQNVYFFAMPMDINNYYKSVKNELTLPIITEKMVGEESFVQVLPKKVKNVAIRKSKLEFDPDPDIPYISMETVGKMPSRFNDHNISDLFVLGMTKGEFAALSALNSGFAAGFKVYLGLKFVEKGTDDKNHMYRAYNFVLNGYQLDAGEYKAMEQVLTSPKIYQYVTR